MSHTPSSIRNELNLALGSQATSYWDTLSLFLSNKISRFEFEESVRVAINTHELSVSSHLLNISRISDIITYLVQLHNSLIVSILGSSLHHAPPTPPPEGPDKPSKKRRKVEHGTNPDGDGSGAAAGAFATFWFCAATVATAGAATDASGHTRTKSRRRTPRGDLSARIRAFSTSFALT